MVEKSIDSCFIAEKRQKIMPIKRKHIHMYLISAFRWIYVIKLCICVDTAISNGLLLFYCQFGTMEIYQIKLVLRNGMSPSCNKWIYYTILKHPETNYSVRQLCEIYVSTILCLNAYIFRFFEIGFIRKFMSMFPRKRMLIIRRGFFYRFAWSKIAIKSQ